MAARTQVVKDEVFKDGGGFFYETASDQAKTTLKAEAASRLSRPCRVFVEGLLVFDQRHRLGTARGSGELLEHAWLAALDKDAVLAMTATPPFMPRLDKLNAAINDTEVANAMGCGVEKMPRISDEDNARCFSTFDFDVDVDGRGVAMRRRRSSISKAALRLVLNKTAAGSPLASKVSLASRAERTAG